MRLIELLRAGDRDEKVEALVVHRTETRADLSERQGTRVLTKRLKEIRSHIQSQQIVAQKFAANYEATSKRTAKLDMPLRATPVSGGALPVARVEVTSKTVEILEDDPNVLAVMPNQRVNLIEPKEVGYQDLNHQEVKDKITWGLKELGIPELWKKAKTKGKGVRVAVLDTGVFGDHPALKGRVKDFVLIDPLLRHIACDPTFDPGQHGTHVCGTIAGGETEQGVAIGVAPDVELFVAGVLFGQSNLFQLVEGLGWAAEKGVDIVSMSLGFSHYEPQFSQLLQFLRDQYDILPVVAIGNENHGNSSCPGNVHSAFSVGAVEKLAGGKLGVSSFSSGASLTFPGKLPPLIHKPDLVAPGHQVLSCIPQRKHDGATYEYNYMSGTSMATPHVAGVAAVLMSAHKDASLDDIVSALIKTAKHPGGATSAPDNRWGYGVVQPTEALGELQLKK
jgi:subtilisin family serine protease